MENKPDRKNTLRGAHPDPKPVFYEITIQGCLDPQWSIWFEGMTLTALENDKCGGACTLITGFVIDQPALYGLLIKIRDLNLTLISVRRLIVGTDQVEEVPIQPEQPGDREKSNH